MISIIFVSFNSQKTLPNCLTELYRHSKGSDNSFEVIVVDNNSQDGTGDALAQAFPQVILLQNSKNLGFGAANNQGVKRARGEYILLLNPDTLADCDLVCETIKFFDLHPDNKNAFGGLLLNLDGSEQRGSRRSFPTLLNAFLHFTKAYKLIKYRRAYDLSWLPIEPHEVECVSGACIGMPKAMYESLGGFDERFFLHFEDIDICKRIWQAGYKLWYYPKVRVFHSKGGSSKSSKEIIIKVNNWFLDSLGKYLWKWDKLSAILFCPILTCLKMVGWMKSLSHPKNIC